MWVDSERGDAGVRVAAADAPLRRAVVALVGGVELVQPSAHAPGCPVLATAQPEGVAERPGEVELDRVVVAVAVRSLQPRVQPLTERAQMRPHAEVDAHDLAVSDLLADPVREVDPDREFAASRVSA